VGLLPRPANVQRRPNPNRSAAAAAAVDTQVTAAKPAAVTTAPQQKKGFLANIRSLFSRKSDVAAITATTTGAGAAVVDASATATTTVAAAATTVAAAAKVPARASSVAAEKKSDPESKAANTPPPSSAPVLALATAEKSDVNTTDVNTTNIIPPGPLDATETDFAVAAKIIDSDAFRTQVLNIVEKRHPKQALVATDVLKAIIQAVTLDVDVVSPTLFAPLLTATLKQVFAVKALRKNRVAKVLLTLELVKAFTHSAYGESKVPESMRIICAIGVDTILALVVKPDGSLVKSDKLKGLVLYQQAKVAARDQPKQPEQQKNKAA
jgi:hypothetical protein